VDGFTGHPRLARMGIAPFVERIPFPLAASSYRSLHLLENLGRARFEASPPPNLGQRFLALFLAI
jgi:hypothetical protein